MQKMSGPCRCHHSRIGMNVGLVGSSCLFRNARKRRRSYTDCQRVIARTAGRIVPLLLLFVVTNGTLLKFDTAAAVLAFTAAPSKNNGFVRRRLYHGSNSIGEKGESLHWRSSGSHYAQVLTGLRQVIGGGDAGAESTASNDIGLDNRQDQQMDSLNETRGATLEPYQILQPDAFPWRIRATKGQEQCGLKSGPDGSDNIVMSLGSALGILTKALTRLSDEGHRYEAAGTDRMVGSVVVDLLNQYSSLEDALTSSSSPEPVVLRIEQILSHEVDPLRWLHANSKRTKESEPVVFFADADGEREAASIGASLTLTDLVFGEGNKSSSWSTVSALPPRAEFYGGSRFDSYSGSDNKKQRQGSEWQSFGDEMWLLPSVELRTYPKNQQSVLAAHVVFNPGADDSKGLQDSIRKTLSILQKLSDGTSPEMAPTDLPPVVRRDYNVGGKDGDGQEAFERGVTAALKAFEDDGYRIIGERGNKSKDEECDSDIDERSDQNLCIDLQKVVLARRADLHMGSVLTGLDLLMALKFGGHKGHLLYLRPPTAYGDNPLGAGNAAEFVGCSPERLFQLSADESNGYTVHTEALAGTRPRGSTPQADRQLLQELITSEKDRSENVITGDFIEEVFDGMISLGILRSREKETNVSRNSDGRTPKIFGSLQQKDENMFFVRRLRQLQHICRLFEGRLAENAIPSDAICHLLQNLHPTPALNGYPSTAALEFIRLFESTSFDRGYYGGPFGYVGRDAADVSVAIRSALLTDISKTSSSNDRQNDGVAFDGGSTRVSIYAGAGIVPGSTVESEWAETSQKLGVLSSLFPPSPITLQDSPTPNVAWATAFVEELIRNGVTQFYVCPGSRSTPLTSALAKATRSRIRTVHAISVHDERGAAFRALGYGRRTGRPAAVVTSSGTAVANLYPAVMEAGMDGVPMLLLTADRPYESRDTGANQSVDQVKAFSSSYTRWFRDILPPSDDVPISVVLSDANHAVTLSQRLMGPVHLNIQFRENLAPDTGAIRNDDRVGSVTAFNSGRFTDAPAFRRWSVGGGRWSHSYYSSDGVAGASSEAAVTDVVALMQTAKRGIIVVGNIRASIDSVEETISDFAQYVGYPIFAGIQGGNLRSTCPSVVPYGEHILKHPVVAQGMKADFILQIGAPLVSTEIGKVVSECIVNGGSHVLVHSHHPSERADPSFTVTHRVSSEAGIFLQSVQKRLESSGFTKGVLVSDLAPLVLLGRTLGEEMPEIINRASFDIVAQQIGNKNDVLLTEPQVALAISEVMKEQSNVTKSSLFLSNSMPVRDAEFFLYPGSIGSCSPSSVAVNRGASGIDGIISSAAGYADSSEDPTTLVVGDLASLHDLNAFHTLARTSSSSSSALQQPNSPSSSSHSPPLTTVIVNNDGGGIFSFLPIAKYGNDVGFEDFFGTPTFSFSFNDAAKAFGLPYSGASSFDEFKKAYARALEHGSPSIVEAHVVGRETNVAVHTEITRLAKRFIDDFLEGDEGKTTVGGDAPLKLPVKVHQREEVDETALKTLLLLHGWMGDKEEWDAAANDLSKQLSSEWKIVAIDLPGHGESPLLLSESHHAVRTALGIKTDGQGVDLSIDGLATAVLTSLKQDHGIDEVDAVCAYSLGGRVAMAMKRAFDRGGGASKMSCISERTKMLLLSAYPGSLLGSGLDAEAKEAENSHRTVKDDVLAQKMTTLWMASHLSRQTDKSATSMWSDLLSKWYGANLWGNIRDRKYEEYVDMIARRAKSLAARGPDLAIVLRACSPPRNPDSDWSSAIPLQTLFMAGEFDTKYSAIGNQWQEQCPGLSFVQVPKSGHALLVDATEEVASALASFISKPIKISEEMPATSPSVTSTRANEVLFLRREFEAQATTSSTTAAISDSLPTLLPKIPVEVGALDYESFSIGMQSKDGSAKGALGIGWGDRAKPRTESKLNERRGFIINLASRDGDFVGIGEVSPLDGLHHETFEDAETSLKLLKKRLVVATQQESLPIIDAEKILHLDGALSSFVNSLFGSLGLVSSQQREQSASLQSVRSGIEMTILSLASQACSTPLPQALATYSSLESSEMPIISPSKLLPINGIVTREAPTGLRSAIRVSGRRSADSDTISYPSVKVKVGYRHSKEDANALVQSLSTMSSFSIDDSTGKRAGGVRADANRAWDEEGVLDFVSALERIDPEVIDRIEFIEEPLQRIGDFAQQVKGLEELYKTTGIRYALDESIAELAEATDYNFAPIADAFRKAFVGQGRAYGCSALVLKPALLGIELSMQLARMAHNELGIGAVFSSSFDSGVGLAYTSFLASVSDGMPSANTLNKYPHGLGTFDMLNGDTLSPAFKSYVKMDGTLQVVTLGRALYGLGLDDMRDLIGSQGDPQDFSDCGIEKRASLPTEEAKEDAEETQHTKQYQAKASTSSTGREISVQVSLPLPFSDAIACARFSDLPQQSRWSPWLNSVAYLDAGGETEWTLNVRGVQYRWRAISKILDNPRGIMWESVSGLKNKGVVEFLPTSEDECLMKVTMSIMTPRVLSSVFRGTSSFVEEFLQNKLLKWSLESFRDVVKADLALERGDVELGDALFGAVEGKMSAIEATLSFPENKRQKDESAASDEKPEDSE